ncbi:MAG TPA: PilZ domain-containing protein [Myxococcaceae bacterium]|nr:PilZ domain-containing protein [Myxococcaceae bacterium]
MSDSLELGSLRERQHPRVAAHLPVEVRGPGMLRQAVAEDISLAGLRVLGLRAPVGQSLTVALPLPGDRRVQLHCSVVRQDATGVALEFDGLDWDDLFALARFLHPRLP